MQFESWIKSELVKHGLIVQYTPGSGDGGADLVVLAPKNPPTSGENFIF